MMLCNWAYISTLSLAVCYNDESNVVVLRINGVDFEISRYEALSIISAIAEALKKVIINEGLHLQGG